MPQSLSKVLVHSIFSTKHREPLLGPGIRPRLHAYIVGILDNLKSPSLQTGGVADHVHILFALGRAISQAELVEEVKKSSSRWMKADGGVPGFTWQAGYGAFSIGESQTDTVIRYIHPISQGVALGYRVVAPLARVDVCVNGAKPVSPGQRPGSGSTSRPSPRPTASSTICCWVAASLGCLHSPWRRFGRAPRSGSLRLRLGARRWFSRGLTEPAGKACGSFPRAATPPGASESRLLGP